MRTLIAVAATVLAASVAAPAVAQNYGPNGYRGDVVRCESIDGRSRECATDGGRLQLLRQLSRSPCVEGRSWGQSRRGVWVAQGCRAEFVSVRRHGGWDNGGRGNDGWGNGGWNDHGIGGRSFVCESNDGRYTECAANTRAGVRLIRQLSNAPCIEGRSWGYGRQGIWVAQGCRAEFRSF